MTSIYIKEKAAKGTPTAAYAQVWNESSGAGVLHFEGDDGNPCAITVGGVTVDNLSIDGNSITASSGAVNITPAAGSAIVLDGTINVDAGVVTGASSITSTTFVGNLTGNASTATSATTAGTVTTAAQPNITSLGTLTTLTVDSITINGTAITGAVSIAATNIIATTLTGTLQSGSQPNITSVGTLTTLNVSGFASCNPLFIFERNTASTDTAGYGQIWVKNDTPNHLKFTNDAGTDFSVAVSSGTTGGTGSAGAGTQYIEISVGGTTYKVLHDGTV